MLIYHKRPMISDPYLMDMRLDKSKISLLHIQIQVNMSKPWTDMQTSAASHGLTSPAVKKQLSTTTSFQAAFPIRAVKLFNLADKNCLCTKPTSVIFVAVLISRVCLIRVHFLGVAVLSVRWPDFLPLTWQRVGCTVIWHQHSSRVTVIWQGYFPLFPFMIIWQ